MSDTDETATAPDASGEEELPVVDSPRSTYDGRSGWRLCAAKRSSGEPCRAPAMIAQKVCSVHGGRSPQAKRSARRRLEFAADAAAAALADIVDSPAATDTDRIRAAKEILDRVGIAARHALELTGADGGPVEVSGLAQRLQQVIAAAEPAEDDVEVGPRKHGRASDPAFLDTDLILPGA